jgi:hypothetical protein
MRTTCNNCGEIHNTATAARDCRTGAATPCTELLERVVEGELYIAECGAASWPDQRGYTCEAGHNRTHAQARETESALV